MVACSFERCPCLDVTSPFAVMKRTSFLSAKTGWAILLAVTLVAGGAMLERFASATAESASRAPRYKTSVRIMDKDAVIPDAPERIESVYAPDLLQVIVQSLNLTSRWNAEETAACGKLREMIEAHVEAGTP